MVESNPNRQDEIKYRTHRIKQKHITGGNDNKYDTSDEEMQSEGHSTHRINKNTSRDMTIQSI